MLFAGKVLRGENPKNSLQTMGILFVMCALVKFMIIALISFCSLITIKIVILLDDVNRTLEYSYNWDMVSLSLNFAIAMLRPDVPWNFFISTCSHLKKTLLYLFFFTESENERVSKEFPTEFSDILIIITIAGLSHNFSRNFTHKREREGERE